MLYNLFLLFFCYILIYREHKRERERERKIIIYYSQTISRITFLLHQFKVTLMN